MSDFRRFERLVLPVLGDLHRFARRLAGDGAEDLLQASLERGLGRITSLRDDRVFKVWQSRVLFNTWRDQNAKLVEFPTDRVDEIAHDRSGPEQAASDSQTGARIREAVDALPPEQRDAVWLVDGQGCGYHEAAEILGAPPGTIASRVARGRLALRVSLAELAAEQGVA